MSDSVSPGPGRGWMSGPSRWHLIGHSLVLSSGLSQLSGSGTIPFSILLPTQRSRCPAALEKSGALATLSLSTRATASQLKQHPFNPATAVHRHLLHSGMSPAKLYRHLRLGPFFHLWRGRVETPRRRTRWLAGESAIVATHLWVPNPQEWL